MDHKEVNPIFLINVIVLLKQFKNDFFILKEFQLKRNIFRTRFLAKFFL